MVADVHSVASIPGRKTLPRTVVALGGVALLMDLSSEMVHALLPVFLVVTLGASVAAVGVIEGIAEATAASPDYSLGRYRIGSDAESRWCYWAMAWRR